MTAKLNFTHAKLIGSAFFLLGVVGCGGGSSSADPTPVPDTGDTSQSVPPPATPASATPSESLRALIESVSNDEGLNAFMLPLAGDYSQLPQDPKNPITEEKVVLGQMLFHETAIATEGVHGEINGTWSCASCHHAAAGFKSGVPQGIGEGGQGFGVAGEARVMVSGFSKDSEDPQFDADVQPFTSPAVLNAAYQEVMLWNGQFGLMEGGNVNEGVHIARLATPGTPKAENVRRMAGLEIQAIAGTDVHRLKVDENSIIQTNAEYVALFNAAYPEGSADVLEDAGKAIAAYERTIIANEAPFQRWLRGDDAAMTEDEIAGASLFFGKAGCVSCHTGPALSSKVGASEDDMFMALGFADFDQNDARISGELTEKEILGRGGFTGDEDDEYQFKVPQLYNLANTNIFGHGASFTTIREVVEYKNNGVSQKVLPDGKLDPRFVALGLTDAEIDHLVVFLEHALYDPNLGRYTPSALPSGACFPVADEQSRLDLNC